MSSPDTHELREVITRYPRGIINPNYPGFQHLAHTLSEHFIDHHQRQHHHHFEQQLSDSELSDEVDFDVLAYRSGNLVNVNIMSDSNNNDNINNNADGAAVVLVEERVIDLNRNKNRQMLLTEHVASDYDMKADDGNVNNLLMKSEPKVFCESKQLEHLVIEERASEFSTDDEDEECCNLSQVEPQQMDFDDDDDDEDMADLSGEDDAAIKNELERIDSADNDFNENINCDLVTYLQQYDFKMDLQKSFQQLDDEKIDDECLTDEDNCKLPTPDILIEHNGSSNNVGNKKLQNDDMKDVINVALPLSLSPREEGNVCDEQQQKTMPLTPAADVSQDEVRDYQPDLIKSIGDNNHGRITEIQQREGDNEISPHAEREIPNNNVLVGGGGGDCDDGGEYEEKIINQVQTERVTVASGTTQLSFDSASSTVDIIGDFGKEIEKEIGLIVSGYLNGEKLSSPQTNEPIRPLPHTTAANKKSSEEIVFDENKFIEHLKYFSKVSSAGQFIYFLFLVFASH